MHQSNIKIVVLNKSRILFLTLIFFMQVGCSVYSVENQRSTLQLSIKVIDTKIVQKSPVKIELNFSSMKDTYRIYKHSSMGIAPAIGPNDWLSFEIITPEGKKFEEYGPHLPNPKRPYLGDYIDIKPGKPYKEIVKVYPSLYDNNKQWPYLGTYKLRATYSYEYKDNFEYGTDLWRGTVVSEWVYFEVISN